MNSSSSEATEAPERPVTLITGTSRGIGRFLAEHYLRAGHQVVGCSRSPAPWSAERYRHVALDVRDERAVVSLFREIRTSDGRLDNLVNNAGIASMNHVITTPISSVRDILETNVTSTFLFAREAAKLMMKRRFGRMVNLTSVAVPMRLEGEAAYAASKAAVDSLTRVLAREFAPFGITVNAVGPGPIETGLIAGVPKAGLERLLARLAIPDFGTPADVANVTDFFLSPASRLITGQVVYLGGA